MASTMFDSVLYRDVFSTPAMRAVFSDDAQLRAYVQAEVALAVAQGEAGVIPREAARGDRAPGPGDRARSRAVETRHRERRLSHRRPGAPALAASRRSRPLRALGGDHPGHHGHGDRAATARSGGADRSPTRRGHGHACRSRPPPSRYADGRANPSSAGPADHVRAQGCGLALGAAALGRSARTSQASRASGAARWRRGNAGVTRRTRTGCARRLRARPRSCRA